jgi:hypothetical protein
LADGPKTSANRRRRVRWINSILIWLLWCGSAAGQPAEPAQIDLRLESAGLVSYNRLTTRLGSLPVSVAYIRGDYRKEGRPYLWPNLEPEPGVYNFEPIVRALDRAYELGIKLGFRIMTAHPWVERENTEYPFFPEWIPFTRKTRGDRTAYAPDWEHPEVKSALRELLVALGKAVNNHPALLFVDVGVLGWVGEWHTTVGFYNSDFMPSTATMLEYLDYHIEAFGADKLLLNLGAMGPRVLSYGLSKGINGIRQDCFGSTYHMDQYESKLEQVPDLQRVIDSGTVFFEICGGNMRDWTHKADDPQGVTLPISEIIDRGIRWKTTLFANMGAPIPERYMDEYLRLHRAIAGFEKVKKLQPDR